MSDTKWSREIDRIALWWLVFIFALAGVGTVLVLTLGS